MSIENNLERIAVALEAIAASMLHPQMKIDLTPPAEPKPKKAPKAEAPAVPVALAPGESVPFAGGVLTNPAPIAAPVAPPAPIAAPAAPVAPPAPVAVAAPPVTMTANDLNAALGAEYARLGSRAPIDNAIRELGYQGIKDMPASLYQELLNKVRAS